MEGRSRNAHGRNRQRCSGLDDGCPSLLRLAQTAWLPPDARVLVVSPVLRRCCLPVASRKAAIQYWVPGCLVTVAIFLYPYNVAYNTRAVSPSFTELMKLCFFPYG